MTAVATRIGTRASDLARTQAGTVADALTAVGLACELVPMTSDGDKTRASLASLGGTGVFAAGLRTALLDGRCDAVVHSLKDLPTTPHPGLTVVATPTREDPRDALCARDGLTLAELPAGARIGTGSPRRAAQLRTRRPDVEVVDIRGNVGTRLSFVTGGELDAVVLAAAGLHRLGLDDVVTEHLNLTDWPTAPGQGVLAVEIRHEDAARDQLPLMRALATIHDDAAWVCAQAERSVLATLEAGCAAPVAAYAELDSAGSTGTGNTLMLHAVAYRPGGGDQVDHRISGAVVDGADAVALGAEAARHLLDAGASAWIHD
ncbi:hydroxymethylbilane synthase [Ruania halotolerans]|uniref:hydroxymethylbilane synthase n=1 Tax=Ruania halotolerans TaxID=2897773 RepID=UPI001E4A12C9|nr:hydroxymethylbilane synthase [Ruania halotolerans]UFU07782.1 hydroxymethylbilane synthase [Ruania halotolerans]